VHKIRGWTSASRRWLRGVRPERSELRGELLAGLPGAISSVPDGMAAAVLAGVNPVQGLYASFAGPVAGGLTSSTRLMVITTTSAAALAAGSALQGVPPDDRPAAIPLLVIMVGIVQVFYPPARSPPPPSVIRGCYLRRETRRAVRRDVRRATLRPPNISSSKC
jgi:MFS superfamily sulfate permease-like transporter